MNFGNKRRSGGAGHVTLLVNVLVGRAVTHDGVIMLSRRIVYMRRTHQHFWVVDPSTFLGGGNVWMRWRGTHLQHFWVAEMFHTFNGEFRSNSHSYVDGRFSG